MQRWGADAIKFMRDASEYNVFNEELITEIQDFLPADGHICDAGCGLGYLSEQLAKVCKTVTAVDLSEPAISFAKKRHRSENLEFLCCDIETLSEQFDAMVFCYFGRTNEILQISRKLCLGNVVIVKRNCSEHRFSLQEVSRKHTVDDTSAFLTQYGIPFYKKKISLELGQPFRSVEDAVRFFQQYDKSNSIIHADMILPRLQKIEHPEYRFYLPEKRSMELIVFRATDIPKDGFDG